MYSTPARHSAYNITNTHTIRNTAQSDKEDICESWRKQCTMHASHNARARIYAHHTHTEVYTHTYAHTQKHTHTHKHAHSPTHASTRTNTHALTHTYTTTRTRTHPHTLTHTHTHPHTHAHAHTHAHTEANMHASRGWPWHKGTPRKGVKASPCPQGRWQTVPQKLEHKNNNGCGYAPMPGGSRKSPAD